MRLIDADALLSGYDVRKVVEYDESGCGLDYKAVPVEAIETAPTIDAVEVVRHGKWEAVENTGPEEWCAPPIRCGNCGKTMPDVGAAFCPFCGQMNAEVRDGKA